LGEEHIKETLEKTDHHDIPEIWFKRQIYFIILKLLPMFRLVRCWTLLSTNPIYSICPCYANVGIEGILTILPEHYLFKATLT